MNARESLGKLTKNTNFMDRNDIISIDAYFRVVPDESGLYDGTVKYNDELDELSLINKDTCDRFIFRHNNIISSIENVSFRNSSSLYPIICESLINDLFIGKNSCVITFGRNLNAVSSLVFGDVVYPKTISSGFVPLSVYSIFEVLKKLPNKENFKVYFSMLEFSVNGIRDSFVPTNDILSIEEIEGEYYLRGLTKQTLNSYEHFERLFNLASTIIHNYNVMCELLIENGPTISTINFTILETGIQDYYNIYQDYFPETNISSIFEILTNYEKYYQTNDNIYLPFEKSVLGKLLKKYFVKKDKFKLCGVLRDLNADYFDNVYNIFSANICLNSNNGILNSSRYNPNIVGVKNYKYIKYYGDESQSYENKFLYDKVDTAVHFIAPPNESHRISFEKPLFILRKNFDHIFEVDKYFPPQMEIQLIYKSTIDGILKSIFDGYNHSLLLAGTSSLIIRQFLLGDSNKNDGFFHSLFHNLPDEFGKKNITNIDLSFSFVEITDNVINDLLCPEKRPIFRKNLYELDDLHSGNKKLNIDELNEGINRISSRNSSLCLQIMLKKENEHFCTLKVVQLSSYNPDNVIDSIKIDSSFDKWMELVWKLCKHRNIEISHQSSYSIHNLTRCLETIFEGIDKISILTLIDPKTSIFKQYCQLLYITSLLYSFDKKTIKYIDYRNLTFKKKSRQFGTLSARSNISTTSKKSININGIKSCDQISNHSNASTHRNYYTDNNIINSKDKISNNNTNESDNKTINSSMNNNNNDNDHISNTSHFEIPESSVCKIF